MGMYLAIARLQCFRNDELGDEREVIQFVAGDED